MIKERKDYYERRKQAVNYIDKMLSANVETPIIKYEITKLFGFSGRIVDERINQLEELLKCQTKKTD